MWFFLQRNSLKFLLPAIALLFPGLAQAGEVTVFAAASLKNALDAIAIEWEEETGHELTSVLAGSSILARQIEQGAPADIFISANADWMNVLERKGLIETATRTNLLGNELVLIAHNADAPRLVVDANLNLADQLGDSYLAMALYDAVPAGIYAKTALQSLGLWEQVADRIAQTDNSRAALALVAMGEAPYGIVYATDAKAEKRVKIVGRFPAESHAPIVYPAAALTSSRNPLNAAILEFLRKPAARAIFVKQGFLALR